MIDLHIGRVMRTNAGKFDLQLCVCEVKDCYSFPVPCSLMCSADILTTSEVDIPNAICSLVLLHFIFYVIYYFCLYIFSCFLSLMCLIA